MKVGEFILSHSDFNAVYIYDRNGYMIGNFRGPKVENKIWFFPVLEDDIIFTKGLNKIWKSEINKSNCISTSSYSLHIGLACKDVLDKFDSSCLAQIVDDGKSLQLATKK